MIEDATYEVRLTLSVRVDFSPIDRDTPLTRSDAIENAFGSVSDDVWSALEDEGWTVDVEEVSKVSGHEYRTPQEIALLEVEAGN